LTAEVKSKKAKVRMKSISYFFTLTFLLFTFTFVSMWLDRFCHGRYYEKPNERSV
jgi:hypothetical protein